MSDDQAAEQCELQDGKVPDWCPARTNRRLTDMQIKALQNQIIDLSTKLDPAVEVWEGLAGMVKVLRWLGIGVTWLVKIGAAVGILWAAVATFLGKGWP